MLREIQLFNPRTILVLLLGVLVGALSIDAQPYWMDELGTWRQAQAHDAIQWLQSFLHIENSDAQLPAYHAAAFLWSRLAGTTELGLRSLNLLFLLLTLMIILNVRSLTSIQRVLWALLVLANCFVWAYLNEARPYVLLLLGSTLLTAAMATAAEPDIPERSEGERSLIPYLAVGGLVSFGASPASAPFIIAAAVASIALAGPRKLWDLVLGTLRHRALSIVYIVLACAIVGLVAYAVLKGATPELRNKTTVASLAFGLIEVGGGAGFTPGRDALRAEGASAVAAWQWTLLFAFAVAGAALLVAALRGGSRRLAVPLLCACVAAAAGVAMLGHAVGFRVIGRHLAWIVSPLMLTLALGLASLPRRTGYALGTVAFLLMASSAIIFRMSPEHKKDDTRAAAMIASKTKAAGGTAWWIGSYLVPDYFGMQTATIAEAARRPASTAQILRTGPNEDWRALTQQPLPPSTIVVERPEANDVEGYFAAYARDAGLTSKHTLRGYVAYTRPELKLEIGSGQR